MCRMRGRNECDRKETGNMGCLLSGWNNSGCGFGSWWADSILKGESFEDGAKRELQEETGGISGTVFW